MKKSGSFGGKDIFEDEDLIDDEDLFRRTRQKLVNGIDLRELRENNDVIFQFNEDYSNVLCEDSSEIYEKSYKEEFENHPNLEKLREARAAPRPECSFDALTIDMKPLDSEGYVKKQIVIAGTGPELPEQVEVVIHYNFYKEHDENPFDSSYLRGRPYKFRLNEAVIPGLEMAVRSMRRGENSRFLIKYEVAFKEQGIPPRIPPKCDIFADITLKDFTACKNIMDPNALTEEELSKKTFEEAMKEVDELRHHGNDFFKNQNFFKAMRCYKKAVNIMNYMHLANEEEEMIMFESKNKTLVNLAVCYLKDRKYEMVCLATQEVLKREPNHAKAIFNFGAAKYHLGDCDTARRFLLKAKKLAPNDKSVNEYLKKVNDKQAASKMIEKEMWRKVFYADENNTTDKKSKSETSNNFEKFEEFVKKELNENFLDSADDFVFNARLVPEEKEICLKIANDLKLDFIVEKEDKNIFKVKKIN